MSQKTKKEMPNYGYKGRANYEASMSAISICIVLIVLGAFVYMTASLIYNM
jgi:hypothetical protein